MDLRVLPLFDAVVKARFPQDVDELHYPLWVDENSDKGDSPMSAETISFEIEVECTRRRDGGKKGLKFRHIRDKSRGRRRGGHAKGTSFKVG